jgi:hypothetical protein
MAKGQHDTHKYRSVAFYFQPQQHNLKLLLRLHVCACLHGRCMSCNRNSMHEQTCYGLEVHRFSKKSQQNAPQETHDNAIIILISDGVSPRINMFDSHVLPAVHLHSTQVLLLATWTGALKPWLNPAQWPPRTLVRVRRKRQGEKTRGVNMCQCQCCRRRSPHMSSMIGSIHFTQTSIAILCKFIPRMCWLSNTGLKLR